MVMPALAFSQWLNYPAPGVPRTHDGKVNLSARVPRGRDGKPDLSGVWHAEVTPVAEFRKRYGDAIVDENIRVTGEGMGIGTINVHAFDAFLELDSSDKPMRPGVKPVPPLLNGSCLPVGFPMGILLTPVHKIIQTPGITLMMLEEGNFTRQIYADARPLPKDPQPSWFGYSIGRWQGDTFVVETNGLNDRMPIDAVGHPRSEAMRITERYRRRDFGHMDVEVTFDDPTLYTHPFSIHFVDELQPDTDILENFCAENEKDARHLKGGR
jgi:hypothetical protein